MTTASEPRLAWDYTDVAHAYLKRPAYAPDAIDAILRHAALGRGARACDVGAGTGKLSLPLLERGLEVVAVEPNDAMRRLGRAQTAHHAAVRWQRGYAEATGLPDGSCDAVGFGSSFNVVDTAAAVRESARILRPGGWVFCLWNHRRLDDALQAAIEDLIRAYVPGFTHGARRADPSAALRAGSWFGDIRALEAAVVHVVSREDFAAAWRSHLTLRRQADDALEDVLVAIDGLLEKHAAPLLRVPYVTRAWLARKRRR